MDWIPASTPPAAIDPAGKLPVEVIGCVDDENHQANGEGAFVDMVAWWPAAKLWTITYAGAEEACDMPVRVTDWQPKPDLPPHATRPEADTTEAAA